MRKISLLLIALFLSTTLFAQNITNTLGTDGNFFVNKLGGTPSFLTLSSTAEHTIQFSTSTSGLTFKNSDGDAVFAFSESHNYAAMSMLIVGHADANWIGSDFAHLQLQSENAAIYNKLNMVARGTVNHFNAYSASGTGAAPSNSSNGQSILHINAYGYQNSGNRLAASINFVVDGTPATNYVPGKISFNTGTPTSTVATRMTIESNGRVNIATVLKLTPGTAPSSPEKGDIYCNDSDSHLYFYNGTTWVQLDN